MKWIEILQLFDVSFDKRPKMITIGAIEYLSCSLR